MPLFKGNVITCDEKDRVFKYLWEDKGRIRYVGGTPPEGCPDGEIIDLGEQALLPAFGDGHLHFSNWALIAGAFFDVRDAVDFEDLGRAIKEFAAVNRNSKVLAAFGASRHSIAERRLITRKELDDFLPDRPLYIICYDGHSAILNSRMLDKIPDEIRAIRGFHADTGHVFHEAYYRATDFVSKTVPPLTMVKSIINGFDLLAERGIGLIHPVEGIGFPRDLDVKLVDWIARARAKKNGFQTRLLFQTMDVDKVAKRKLPRIGGCFATALDGCFGVCDAALHSPYSNDPDNRGILFYSDEQVVDFAKRANRAGLQIEMHAIGDAAVSQAIRALSEALRDFPREDHRHTLIHACLITPEDLRKCADLGIGITLQPGFLISPLEPVDYLEEILGQRVRTSSPLRDMLDSGILLSGGSDAPVTPPDPITGIYGACNHPYDPGQSLTIPEALKMFTSSVARTSFDEHERGTLENGKVADMVVLNKNPLDLAPDRLLDLKVEDLYLSGKKYRPGMGVFEMVGRALAGRKMPI